MKRPLLLALLSVSAITLAAQTRMPAGMSGGEWPDNGGTHINAHGGNIIRGKGVYYWYGESRSDDGRSLGVSCYTSRDLRRWKARGLVMPVSEDPGSDIADGCIIERPKVVYCAKTRQYVMWFHLELKGRGYAAARCGVAVASKPLGPFRLVRSGRVNPGIFPIGFSRPDTADLRRQLARADLRAWSPQWLAQVERGMIFMRDLGGGQMSRDMTIFVDDDGKAYHIYSSEENMTLQIAQLTDDFTAHNGTYVRVAAGGQNEAPAIFKHGGVYWMVTSGCTGWAPNAARLFRARNILGPWEQLPNPCRGEGAGNTFGAQGCYILRVPTAAGRRLFGGAEYVFMADIWNPGRLSASRHLWLPIAFEDGLPVLRRK